MGTTEEACGCSAQKGQLGQGDLVTRNVPTIVKGLAGKKIIQGKLNPSLLHVEDARTLKGLQQPLTPLLLSCRGSQMWQCLDYITCAVPVSYQAAPIAIQWSTSACSCIQSMRL